MPHATAPTHDALARLSVFERGWLSSNNLLIHPAPGEAGAVLIDSGHVNHAAQTVALVTHALHGTPLVRVVNTHLHSDHCGGNAALAQATGAQVTVPPGEAADMQQWHVPTLSHWQTGQRLGRFEVQATLGAGDVLVAGGREWQVLAAPGHDPHSVMLFDAVHGLLLSADALWEHGFGVVFPELSGEPGFDDVAAVLDRISALSARLVVPGHGAPFTDVNAALARARQRVAGMKADPARHARHGLRVLLKYHLMEEGSQALPALLHWATMAPLVAELWRRFAPGGAAGEASADGWVLQALEDLAGKGALRREVRDGMDWVVDA